MKKSQIKKFIQKTIGSVEYEIKHKRGVMSAFAVQRQLINNKKDAVIFDVGAHYGKITKAYRKTFPQAKIYAFEPSPGSFEELARDISADKNISGYSLALSDKKEIVTMNINAFSGTNSLLATDEKADVYWGKGKLETKQRIEVEATSIDLFCKERAIPEIDILKLDIQGHELTVLKGAEEMLKKKSIALIYFELLMVPTYKGQPKMHEYLSFLDSFGYELFDFYHPGKKNKQLLQIDALFVKGK